jgi:hypothetical protein
MKKLAIIIVSILLFAVPVMATSLAPTVTSQYESGTWGDWTVSWIGITTTASTCTPYTKAYSFASMTVQVVGTWGGATITLFGSNDGGSTWFALKALSTVTAISMTADAEAIIMDTPVKQIKWVIAGGDGTTFLSVYVQGQR